MVFVEKNGDCRRPYRWMLRYSYGGRNSSGVGLFVGDEREDSDGGKGEEESGK